MNSSTRIWRHFDVWLLMVVVVLTVAGVALIRSAIAGNEDLAERVPSQAIYATAGLLVLFLTAGIDYRIWSALSRPIYIVNITLLVLIFISGFAGFGAERWFQLGVVTIQPSELAKVLMILVLADYLARNRDRLNTSRVLLRSLLLVGLPALLILGQPDLSTAVVLFVIWFALVWAAGLQLRRLAIFAGAIVLVAAILTPLITRYLLEGYPNEEDFLFLRHYQMTRVVNFLFPNPEESFGDIYNVEQARIAIGSGGLFGQGYGSGSQVQLRFLKVRHTDFIFSAMAHEFGFVGAALFFLLLLFVILRCLRAARMARDLYGSLISYGVAVLLLFQVSFNIGMNLNLFPVSGLPLPFLSSGGSSLLTSLLAVGLVESVNLRHKRIEL